MGKTSAFAANSRGHRVIARLYQHKKPIIAFWAPDQAALGFDGKLLELLLRSLGLRLSDFTASVSDDPRGCDGMTGAGQLGGDTFETGDCRCMELPQWPDACLAILVTSTELHSTGWRTGRCL